MTIVILLSSIISSPADVLRCWRHLITCNRSSSPHGPSMGRKSKKHKGMSDGSDNEADDDRHGTSNLISGMGGANFHMNVLLAL